MLNLIPRSIFMVELDFNFLNSKVKNYFIHDSTFGSILNSVVLLLLTMSILIFFHHLLVNVGYPSSRSTSPSSHVNHFNIDLHQIDNFHTI